VVAGAALLVVVAAVAAVTHVASLWVGFDSKTEKIATAFPDELTRPEQTPAANGRSAVNFLLVGSDSRSDKAQQAESGQASDQRSDTIMLVHIPADRQNIYVASIMRDTWVAIPGHGSSKINAALAYGGVPLMVQTVESIFAQRIDHVVFIDLDGFRGLTDAVGGVDVNVPVSFTSTMPENPLRFEQGPRHMDGKTAFAFIHERYAFRDGDYQRVRNQQTFLKSLLNKVIRPETLANPVTAQAIVGDFSPYLTVDATLTSAAMMPLALELGGIKPEDIVMFTVPTAGIGRSDDGQSIVLLDETKADGFAESMSKGTLSQFVADNNLGKGN
jgi:LCP family protein required for cell wall assembly